MNTPIRISDDTLLQLAKFSVAKDAIASLEEAVGNREMDHRYCCDGEECACGGMSVREFLFHCLDERVQKDIAQDGHPESATCCVSYITTKGGDEIKAAVIYLKDGTRIRIHRNQKDPADTWMVIEPQDAIILGKNEANEAR